MEGKGEGRGRGREGKGRRRGEGWPAPLSQISGSAPGRLSAFVCVQHKF